MDDALKVLEFVRVGGLVSAITILFITWLIGRGLAALAGRWSHTFVRQRLLVEQGASLIRFGVYVIGAGFALRMVFDLSDQVLTVVGGTVVVTVGLVLKDQASSVLAAITILVEKPFHVGDRVAFAGYYGEIKSIGLRSVRLVTLDDNEVTIPNSKFLTDPVSSGNSGELTMLVQQDFYIGIDQDVSRAKALVEDALTSSAYFYAGRPWVVLVNQVVIESMVAVRLRAKAYVLDIKYEKAFESDVAEQALEAFRAQTIHGPSLSMRAG